MNKLFITLQNEVLKARELHGNEKLLSPIRWKEIEFEFITSPFMMINWPILLPELPTSTAHSLLELVGARYPFSPYYQELKSLCPQLCFENDKDEWVFFGGSFDPWHAGHQACLNLLPPEKLCFIIPDRNPLKEFKNLDPVATVIELVKKIKFGKNHYLAPSFLIPKDKNPTVSWIERLKENFPEKKMSLLIGYDAFKNFMAWQRPKDLLNRLDTLYVASRLENEQERDISATPIKQIAPHINIVFLGRHEFEGLASTNMRKKKGPNGPYN